MCEVGPGQRSLVPRKRRPSSETPKGKTLKIALPEPRAKGRKREKNNRESKSGGEEKEFSFLDDGLTCGCIWLAEEGSVVSAVGLVVPFLFFGRGRVEPGAQSGGDSGPVPARNTRKAPRTQELRDASFCVPEAGGWVPQGACPLFLYPAETNHSETWIVVPERRDHVVPWPAKPTKLSLV